LDFVVNLTMDCKSGAVIVGGSTNVSMRGSTGTSRNIESPKRIIGEHIEKSISPTTNYAKQFKQDGCQSQSGVSGAIA
jgi:hypothetical protein